MVLVTLRLAVDGADYFRRVLMPAVPRKGEGVVLPCVGRNGESLLETAIVDTVAWFAESKDHEPFVIVILSKNGRPADLSQWSTEL